MVHILYIEDEKEIGTWVTDDLTKRGYRVTWLQSGDGVERYIVDCAIVIADKGTGMKTVSDEKGEGIGLSIVDRMVKEMKLDWEIDTSDEGTVIKIIKMRGKFE